MAAPPEHITILDRIHVMSTSPERVGLFDEIISYQDQARRTYLIIIPSEELEEKTDEEQERIIRDRIRAQVEERRRWIGRGMTI